MIEDTARQELVTYIKQAKELLGKTKHYYSIGNQEALEDMIEQAEMALEGKKATLFQRNRGFYEPEDNEAVRFAINRYTMAGTYLDGKVYDYYGLKKAMEWYQSIDLSKADMQTLSNRAYKMIHRSEQTLEHAEYGVTLGCLDKNIADKLQKEVDKTKRIIKTAEKDDLIKAIVRITNLLRELRFSKVLRSDIDKNSTLLITDKELENIIASLQTDQELQKQFNNIKEKADKLSLEEIQYIYKQVVSEDDYDEMNQRFFLWSSSDKIANFQAPSDAKYALVSIILPSEENEEEGLGHVWIDNVAIMSGSGKELGIKNSGFEEGRNQQPYCWRPVSIKGNPVALWEDHYPYCGTEERSIYLCNPSRNDEGAWVYQEKLPVTGGEGYTITFHAKLDGKLKKGVKFLIEFENEKETKVGEFEYCFNRKSYLKINGFNLNMQCDAIMYAITKEISYAKKAKYEILCFLQDFCQGAEHWMVKNARPDGSDAYGAVQGGRNLAVIACTYSLIKSTDIWETDEKEKFYQLIDYMLRYMLDLRDRTELSAEEAQRGCSNWQTDMCMGVSLIMMVLEDFPNRKSWLYNAHAILKAQLSCNVNPDGSWPESIRYHHATLEHFAGYARAVQINLGENWFHDTELKEMFTFSLNLQTPAYVGFENKISTPPFGDHALSNGKEFAIYGIYLKIIEAIDKKAADRMYATWQLAGKPSKELWGESIILDNLLASNNNYHTEPGFRFELASTADFVNAGIYVFRKGFGQDKQSYFAIMSSPEPVKHGHLDQGSFIIYKDSIPIVMDSGIEGYFDTSTEWHLSSYSHACMMFAYEGILHKQEQKVINLSAGTFSNERGWVDVPRTSKVLGVSIGSEIESIKIRIDHPEGNGYHIREVYWIKPADLYIIRDSIENYEGKVLFNLPVVSKHTEIFGQSVVSKGHFDIDLETVFLSSVDKLQIEEGRTAPFLPSKDKVQMLEYIRAEADAKHGFLVLLYPKDSQQPSLNIGRYEEDNYLIKVGNNYKVQLENVNSEVMSVKMLTI